MIDPAPQSDGTVQESATDVAVPGPEATVRPVGADGATSRTAVAE